jgi:replication factor A1
VLKKRVIKLVKHIWSSRGRPSDSAFSYKRGRSLEYLARIAVKNKLNLSEFLDCIMDAWSQEESKCKELNIWCRKKTKDSAIFLFTNAEKVVAQLPISASIRHEEHYLRSYMEKISAKNASANNSKSINPKITELKPGMKNVNLQAKVIELPETKIVSTRYGNTVSVSNALIEDETGSVRMTLWSQQSDNVHKGDMIDIKNSKVKWFNGQRYLSLGRRGSLTVIE